MSWRALSNPPLTEEELSVALRLVQTLDRPGVASAVASECLTCNSKRCRSDTPGRAVAREIVEHHLERLARREHAELQKQLGCTAEELRDGMRARAAARSEARRELRSRATTTTWCPTSSCGRCKGKLGRDDQPGRVPRARIHRVYAELFAQSAGASRSPLAQQLQEARWLMRNARAALHHDPACRAVHRLVSEGVLRLRRNRVEAARAE